MRAFLRDACGRAWGEGDGEAIALLELAAHEAATNVIRHAYQGEGGRPIELVIDVNDEQACVTILHRGRDFDPDAVRPPDFDGSREGGFGLYLIMQSVDDVSFCRDEDGRCGVRLVKARRRP
jgi:serine/threonine-protein kinase RsbW